MNNLLLETPKNFRSLKEYKQVISSFKSIKSNQISNGFLYSFSYDYSTDVDFKILRFYDSFPLSLMFTIKDSNHCFGINFHRMPLLTRNWFISKLQGLNKNAFSKNGCNKIRMNYSTLKSIMRKVPYLVRQYRMDRMSNIKVINNKQWNEIVKYQPPTFHSATFPQLVNDYNNFQPKSPLKESLQNQLNPYQNPLLDHNSFQSYDPKIFNLLQENQINPFPIF